MAEPRNLFPVAQCCYPKAEMFDAIGGRVYFSRAKAVEFGILMTENMSICGTWA